MSHLLVRIAPWRWRRTGPIRPVSARAGVPPAGAVVWPLAVRHPDAPGSRRLGARPPVGIRLGRHRAIPCTSGAGRLPGGEGRCWISQRSAAALWHLDVPPPPRIDLLALPSTRVALDGIDHHRSRCLPLADLAIRRFAPVTSVARTLVDCVSHLPGPRWSGPSMTQSDAVSSGPRIWPPASNGSIAVDDAAWYPCEPSRRSDGRAPSRRESSRGRSDQHPAARRGALACSAVRGRRRGAPSGDRSRLPRIAGWPGMGRIRRAWPHQVDLRRRPATRERPVDRRMAAGVTFVEDLHGSAASILHNRRREGLTLTRRGPSGG